MIMGGLVVSTFLTSILLPTLAALSEDGFDSLGDFLRRMFGNLARRKAADK